MEKIYYEHVKLSASNVAAGKDQIFRLKADEETNGRGLAGRTAIEATIVAGAAEGTGSGGEVTPEERAAAAKRSTKALIDYAKDRGVWFNPGVIEKQHQYLDEGTEATVYIDRADPRFVIKIASFVDDTPLRALDNRIALYNYLFPGTAYEVLGFTQNEWGDLAYVLRQPFIKGKQGASSDKIAAMMKNRGMMFTQNAAAYTSNDHIAADVHEVNVITVPSGEVLAYDAVPGLNKKNRQYQEFQVSPAKKVGPARKEPAKKKVASSLKMAAQDKIRKLGVTESAASWINRNEDNIDDWSQIRPIFGRVIPK